MRNLFVYGTLMYEEVWNKLIKKTYQRTPAYLPRYKRTRVKNQLYPGIIKQRNSSVNGLLIHNLSTADIKILDRFEGEYYQRTRVNVFCHGKSYKADTYIIKNRYKKLLSKDEWQPDSFHQNQIHLFLSSYKNFHS